MAERCELWWSSCAVLYLTAGRMNQYMVLPLADTGHWWYFGAWGATNSEQYYEEGLEVQIFTFQYPLEKQPSEYIFN